MVEMIRAYQPHKFWMINGKMCHEHLKKRTVAGFCQHSFRLSKTVPAILPLDPTTFGNDHLKFTHSLGLLGISNPSMTSGKVRTLK